MKIYDTVFTNLHFHRAFIVVQNIFIKVQDTSQSGKQLFEVALDGSLDFNFHAKEFLNYFKYRFLNAIFKTKIHRIAIYKNIIQGILDNSTKPS